MGFRWGFEWGKVGSGALMVLIGGSISFVLYFGAGSFNREPLSVETVSFELLLAAHPEKVHRHG